MKTKIQSKNIPTNIPELQALVLDLISSIDNKNAEISKKDTELKNKDTEIELLRHKLQAQLSARFASKSEKNKYQTDLFDEAKENGWQRQVEMNEIIKVNLEKIIKSLEAAA